MPFVKVDPANLPKRVVISVAGGPKVGKTHFALTAPPPISYLSLDCGVYELLHKFPNLDIQIADHAMTEDNSGDTYRKLLNDITRDYLWALSNTEEGGSVVIDTGTQVWQIVQRIHLGEIYEKKVAAFRAKYKREPEDHEVRLMQFDYGAANTYMAGLIRRSMQQYRVNVIWLHRTREKYNAQGQSTGVLEQQGFLEMPALVQMSIMLQSRKLKEGEGSPDGPNFEVSGRIDSCRFDKELEGLVIPRIDFSTIVAALG